MIRILKRLFRLMSQYKGRLYLGIALSMISNILGIVPIICGVWTIKLILDDSNGAAVLEPVYVLQLTTIILGSVLLRWLFAYIRATRQDSIAHEVTCAERLKIGDILKRVSLGFLQRKNMGEFTTAITTDLAFFEMQTMNVVNNIIDSYIFLAITIIWLLCFSPFFGGGGAPRDWLWQFLQPGCNLSSAKAVKIPRFGRKVSMRWQMRLFSMSAGWLLSNLSSRKV